MMSGYVSKDQVIEWFRPYGYVNEGIAYYKLVTDICDMPDADVVPVEVVYCKDCKYCSSGNCEHPRHHGVLPSAYPFDFCNYGVNKHGN